MSAPSYMGIELDSITASSVAGYVLDELHKFANRPLSSARNVDALLLYLIERLKSQESESKPTTYQALAVFQQHLSHCNLGEYVGRCRYAPALTPTSQPTCPVLSDWAWLRGTYYAEMKAEIDAIEQTAIRGHSDADFDRVGAGSSYNDPFYARLPDPATEQAMDIGRAWQEARMALPNERWFLKLMGQINNPRVWEAKAFRYHGKQLQKVREVHAAHRDEAVALRDLAAKLRALPEDKR